MRVAVEEFLLGARQRGRSRATVVQYRWHLERLAVWLEERGVVVMSDVGRSVLRVWGAGIRDGWSPATVRQGVCAARSWLAWCAGEGWVVEGLAGALEVPRVPVRRQRTLSVQEVGSLLGACSDGGLRGVRDAALVSVLVDVGLRAGEVCRLETACVDVEAGALWVVCKGGAEEVGYFGGSTARRLGSWLDVRPAAVGVGQLFVSVGGIKPGHGLTVSGLRVILRRLGRRAGVEGVCPHALRRSFACIMTEAGAPSRVVQLAGRWSNLAMVERYTSGLSAGRLVRRYSPADWIDGAGGDS